MADALERITNLVALLLSTRVPLTLDQIVNDLAGQYPPGEAAMRGAFERDKALLRDIGVPIEAEVLSGNDAGKTGYLIDRARYELADLRLEPDEQAALQVAVAAARLGEGNFGLLKLGAARGNAPVVVANIPELDALPFLREAAALRAEASFEYHGRERHMHPYTLMLSEGFWYVIGHDLGYDEVRTYRVDRIDGAVTVGEPDVFSRPDDFDPRAKFPADARMLGDEPDARATVLIDAARVATLADDLGSDALVERRSDGSLVVSVPCTNLDAFRSWLFGLGVHAEVLGPPEVRASIVDWLRALAATGEVSS